jgi:Zn/Cd-binding protein ZinT
MREFRRKTHRFGTPELDASPKSDHTFQSVYGYPQDTVNKILSQGHTRDLKGLPVYSDYLYIDVDQDDNVDIVRQKLRVLGIKIMEYTTGNRGIHFHIPITRMEGTDVVYSQKVWLREKELVGSN